MFVRGQVASLIAADNSQGMLEVAEANRLDPAIPEQLIETSAFDIAMPENSVDLVACMRLYHHVARPEDCHALLTELKRVSRRYVVLSLWVDGNLQGNRRLRKPQPPIVTGYGRRRCRRRGEVEAEFAAENFRIVNYFDVWPGLYMWRLYLLEHD